MRRSVVLGTLLLFLGAGLWGCNDGPPNVSKSSSPRFQPTQTRKVSEVSPPEIFQALRRDLDSYQPQVTILSPRNGVVIDDDQVTVQLQVRDLPVFRDEDLGLGPYLQVYLDDQPSQAVYDANQTLIFQGLMPGTHTIRAIAARPWHETYKNEGAFAEVIFHSFTKTPKNNPDPTRPLLTYSRPQGTVGAEPVMLDFHLTNAPLHLIAQESTEDDIKDWRIRCTVNGESFVFDEWRPIYLKGLKPGKNWVQLELLDEDGLPTENAFNNTARLIIYEPGGTDSLSRLVRGEVAIAEALAITDPNYVVPAPPEPEPIAPPEDEVIAPLEPSPESQIEAPQPSVEEPAPEEEQEPEEELREDDGEPFDSAIPEEIAPPLEPSEEPEDIEATPLDESSDVLPESDLEDKATEEQAEPEDKEQEPEVEPVLPPVISEPEAAPVEEPAPVEVPQDTKPSTEPEAAELEEAPTETEPEAIEEPAVTDEDVPEVLVAPSTPEPAPEVSPEETPIPATPQKQKPAQKLQERFQRMRSRLQETLKERTKGANPSAKPSVEATPEAQQPILPPPDITPEHLPSEPQPVVPTEPEEIPPVAPAPPKLPPAGNTPWI
ncbi:MULTISPECIES: hypothetical protein [unclassified Leptolyngbya]|uniref:hypothetical protein n=1 Tax=unclassified Leptolyngbya TaxID=2650499 RepID=UPI001688CD92|nr:MULTISPECIES: hypothetical protein [unclassified Leptolyngbya]MBD1910288.1 hypothetical protein [Leptolyngbya sp. FACHB-8]MBD2155800.1 hypothetical protein [Leptolyngbya sp. FACHB-16]